MQYLTSHYYRLMHSFTCNYIEHCLERESRESNPYYKSYESFVSERGTLRIDGGRRTGKTQAIADFSAAFIMPYLDSPAENNEVIVLASTKQNTLSTIERIQRETDKNGMKKIHSAAYRAFLNGSLRDRFRGRSVRRLLIVVDELMFAPDIKAISEEIRLNFPGVKNPPMIFVVGMV